MGASPSSKLGKERGWLQVQWRGDGEPGCSGGPEAAMQATARSSSCGYDVSMPSDAGAGLKVDMPVLPVQHQPAAGERLEGSSSHLAPDDCPGSPMRGIEEAAADVFGQAVPGAGMPQADELLHPSLQPIRVKAATSGAAAGAAVAGTPADATPSAIPPYYPASVTFTRQGASVRPPSAFRLL